MAYVMVKEPGKAPEVLEVGDDQESLNKAIKSGIGGGWIQHVDITVDGVRFDCWMDEEGKLKNMAPNVAVPGDVFCGPIVMTGGMEYATGLTMGLNPKQLAAAKAFATGTAKSLSWAG